MSGSPQYPAYHPDQNNFQARPVPRQLQSNNHHVMTYEDYLSMSRQVPIQLVPENPVFDLFGTRPISPPEFSPRTGIRRYYHDDNVPHRSHNDRSNRNRRASELVSSRSAAAFDFFEVVDHPMVPRYGGTAIRETAVSPVPRRHLRDPRHSMQMTTYNRGPSPRRDWDNGMHTRRTSRDRNATTPRNLLSSATALAERGTGHVTINVQLSPAAPLVVRRDAYREMKCVEDYVERETCCESVQVVAGNVGAWLKVFLTRVLCLDWKNPNP